MNANHHHPDGFMPDWQAIVDQHGPVVWRTAHRLLADEAEAADCFQETFVAVVHASNGAPIQNWAALLRKIATARALDRLRRRIDESRQTLNASDWDGFASPLPGPGEEVAARELADQARQALVHLPARQAEVLCLRCLEELSYEEIAEHLHIRVNAVGVLLHKARKRMRKMLNLAESD